MRQEKKGQTGPATVETESGEMVQLTGHLPDPFWLDRSQDKTGVWRYSTNKNASIVVSIFHLSINGMTADQISKTIRARLRLREHNTRWNSTAVKSLLQDRRVTGEFRPPEVTNREQAAGGRVIKKFFPCVIPVRVFDQAKRSRPSGRRREHYPDLFTGLTIRCANCGLSMKYGGEESNAYFSCANKECASYGRKWIYGDFEESFDSFFELYRKVRPKTSDQLEAVKFEIKQIEAKLREISKRLREKKRDQNRLLKYAEREDRLYYLMSQKLDAGDPYLGIRYKQRAAIAKHLKNVVSDLVVDSVGVFPDMTGRTVRKRQFAVWFNNGNDAWVVPDKKNPRIIKAWGRSGLDDPL